MKTKSLGVKNLVMGAVCIALGIYLPFLTGQIPSVGSMLLPMHIPVLLAGYLCGGPMGLIVGAVTPLLRSMLYGMPPMYPAATAMAFELAAYGLLTGLLYRKFGKDTKAIYMSLISAMIGGRIVWGVIMWAIMSTMGGAFTMAAFIAGAFTNAVPGIILQIVIIPVIVMALKKSKVL
ncbi:MAG: ECF transporter S component [Clostridiaceae bacterium]|nr:ECF transporter S component [Clostridiaceae bacterium]